MRYLLCAAVLSLLPMFSHASLRVMTFNIHGLPWPFTTERDARVLAIADKLADLRSAGTAPHVVLLQEAFGGPIDQIIKRGGYAFATRGPSETLCSPEEAARSKDPKSCIAFHVFNSGLYILSDYPILSTSRVAFGGGEFCAGWDCGANKGGLYAMIQVPGTSEPIHVYTTHLNCDGASGTSYENVAHAQRLQLVTLQRFVSKTQIGAHPGPTIFAGDFNVKSNDPTYPDMVAAMNMPNAGLVCVADVPHCQIPANTVPSELFERVDHHFFNPTGQTNVAPVFASHTLTRITDGHDFSDHPAYTVEYLLTSMTDGVVASRARFH